MLLDVPRACAWANYQFFGDWQELAPEDQAYLVAAFQIEREIEALMQHEAIETAKKAAKRPGKKP